MGLIALLCAQAPLTAFAGSSSPGALGWYVAFAGESRRARAIGRYKIGTAGVVALDPLTLFATPPIGDLPRGETRAYVLLEPSQDRIAAAFLIFDDAVPVCGADVGTIGVDSGTAAFVTPEDLTQLTALSANLAQNNRDLYNDYFAKQMPETSFSRMLRLPNGRRFPGFSAGWGDGGYPVARLDDASGRPVALYADFMGDARGEWILPRECGR